MNTTSALLLIGAGLFFVVGIVLIFLFLSDKKSEKRKIEQAAMFDEKYAYHFNDAYMKACSISGALERLADYYEDNPVMKARIEKAIAYLGGDYGDYETALALINTEGDKTVTETHEKAISLEISKKYGLPGA